MPALQSIPPEDHMLTASPPDVDPPRAFGDESGPVAIHVPAYTAPRSMRAAAAFAFSPPARRSRRSRLGLAVGVGALTVALALALASWSGAAETPSVAPSLDVSVPAAAAR